MKWIYRENYGVIVNDVQYDLLRKYFPNDKPEDSKKLIVVHVDSAVKMVDSAISAVKNSNESIGEKPKRKRRTKSEIEESKEK